MRLLGTGVGSGAILLAYLVAALPGAPGALAPWLLGAGVVVLLPSVLGLGLRGSVGLRVMILVLLFGILAAGLGGVLMLAPEGADASLVLGLPRRAALLLYGVGLLPGVLLSLVFAWSFDRTALSRSRLLELEEQLRAIRRERGPE
jgi:hypothetical protein